MKIILANENSLIIYAFRDAKAMILEMVKNIRTKLEDFNDKRILVMNAATVEAVNLI